MELSQRAWLEPAGNLALALDLDLDLDLGSELLLVLDIIDAIIWAEQIFMICAKQQTRFFKSKLIAAIDL